MHLGPITSVVVNPTGEYIFTGGYDKRVMRWRQDVRSCTLLDTHDHLVNALAMSKNGVRLASASSDYTISIYDLESNRKIRTLKGHADDVESVQFARDDTVLVSSSQDTRVLVWDIETGSILTVFREHSKVVNAIWCVGDRIFSAADDGRVLVWEMMTGQIIDEMSFAQDLDTVDGHEELGLFAVGCDDGMISLYDVTSLKMQSQWNAHERGIKSLRFSPTGKYLLSAGYDHESKVWSVQEQTLLRSLQTHPAQWERDFAWSPDEQTIYGGSFGCTYCEWDVMTGYLKHPDVVLSSPSINDLSVSRDGQVVTASDDGVFRMNGEILHDGLGVLTNGVCITPDGRCAMWGDHAGLAHLLDLHTGHLSLSLLTHTGPINAIKFSEEQQAFYVGTYGGYIHRLNLGDSHWSEEWRAHIGAVKALEVQDHLVYSASSDRTIRLFDQNRDMKQAFEFHGPTGIVNDMALDRDHDRIAVVSRDLIVRLYDVRSGRLIAQHKTHRYSIKSVGIWGDGRYIASGDYWGYVVIWDVHKGTTKMRKVGSNGISALRAHQDGVIACSYDGGVFHIRADGTFENMFRLFDQSEDVNPAFKVTQFVE
ncbi:MAG: WD40 repeat domain-containing protein [Tumebacillaceae bacterium]